MKNSYAEEVKPLTNIQRLMDIANNRIDAGVSHPVGLPEHPQEIAKSWINFVEPRMKYEIATNKGDPYQERLVHTLVKFYKSSHADQRYLMQLRSKGIYWRGDSIKFMKMRANVTPDMLANKEHMRMSLHSMINKIGKAA